MCLLSEQLVAERLPPRLLEAYHLLTPGARVAVLPTIADLTIEPEHE